MQNRKQNSIKSHARKPTNTVERGNSANRERRIEMDSNQLKSQHDQLLNLIKDHLKSCGYNRTVDLLKTERPVKKLAELQPKQESDNKIGIMQCFDRGNREDFFKMASRLFLQPEDIVKKLQFECLIYFCIYPIHPSFRKGYRMDQPSVEAFKKFLDNKGSDLANNTEYLQLFALPYMPKPQEQSAIGFIFTKDWIQKLKNKLIESLSQISKNSARQTPLKAKSQLQEICQNFLHSGEESSQSICKENCKHHNDLKEANGARKDLESYIQILQLNYNKVVEASKSNLIESNKKWFTFAKDLLVLAKKAAKGEKVPQLDKYEGFFGKNIDELIYGSSSNDISIFEKNSYMMEECSVAVSKNIKKSDTSPVCQIDIHKIMNLFLHADQKSKETEICLLLRALKQRLTSQKTLYARKEIITEYIRYDVCGISAERYFVQKKLLTEGTPLVKKSYLRLVNHISANYIGVKYLIGSDKLIENLTCNFGEQSIENPIRQDVIGILQRLTYFHKARMLMVSFGIITFIFNIFRTEKEDLQEFIIQYLASLLMNLALVKESKLQFERHKSELISLTLSYINHENQEIRNFINGILYLALTSKTIRDEAIKHKLHDVIQDLIDSASVEDDTFINQYRYILSRLEGQDENIFDDYDEDEVMDEDTEAEGFENEEDASMASDTSSEDYIDGEEDYLNGQEFLLKEFALLGPQAVREHILTRSILDESTKRVNLTTSINHSRRIDNIFNQRPGTPTLQPQLDKLLNKK